MKKIDKNPMKIVKKMKKPKDFGMMEYKIGRPPKYNKKTFAAKVAEYIAYRESEEFAGAMTVLDFCRFAGVYKDYVSEHDKGDKSDYDFSDSIKILKSLCEYSLEYRGLNGQLNPTMAIFALKNNYAWKDTQVFTGPNGEALHCVNLNVINGRKNVS